MGIKQSIIRGDNGAIKEDNEDKKNKLYKDKKDEEGKAGKEDSNNV